MRHFTCQCRNTLFFDNTVCLQCGREAGYDPVSAEMVPLGEEDGKMRCQNGVLHDACNWVAMPDGDGLCKSCRLNRTIPDLSLPGHLEAWRRVESAKRRVLYTLFAMEIDPPRWVDDPAHGLSFDILSPLDGAAVLTGYADGVITLNLNEADNAERERSRTAFAEPYRTLVGHFRHETAHYLWQQFFGGKPDEDPELRGFRELFGDERADYGQALQNHYLNGPPPGWESEFISSYATAHPHEDWAECWAHYMHLMDGSETATSFGFNGKAVPIPFTKFPPEAAELPEGLALDPGENKRFMDTLHGWARLSPALNEMAASMGQETLYPFVFSLKVVKKLCFVHSIVLRHRQAGLMPKMLTSVSDSTLPQP